MDFHIEQKNLLFTIQADLFFTFETNQSQTTNTENNEWIKAQQAL